MFPLFLIIFFCTLPLIICVDSPWISIWNESEKWCDLYKICQKVAFLRAAGTWWWCRWLSQPGKVSLPQLFWSRHKFNNILVIYMAFFPQNNNLRASEGMWTDPVQCAKLDWPEKNQYSRWGMRTSYRPLRKHRLGRQGGRVALYGIKQLECTELCLGMDEKPNDSL